MQFTADLTADTIALLEARARNGHDAGRIVNGLFVAIFTVLKHDKEFTLQHDSAPYSSFRTKQPTSFAAKIMRAPMQCCWPGTCIQMSNRIPAQAGIQPVFRQQQGPKGGPKHHVKYHQ